MGRGFESLRACPRFLRDSHRLPSPSRDPVPVSCPLASNSPGRPRPAGRRCVLPPAGPATRGCRHRASCEAPLRAKLPLASTASLVRNARPLQHSSGLSRRPPATAAAAPAEPLHLRMAWFAAGGPASPPQPLPSVPPSRTVRSARPIAEAQGSALLHGGPVDLPGWGLVSCSQAEGVRVSRARTRIVVARLSQRRGSAATCEGLELFL